MIRLLPVLLLLAACATPVAPPATRPAGIAADQPQMPPYVRYGFEPFTRGTVIAIARREWRAFGSPVWDGPADAGYDRDSRPDHQPGMWQRVADYWWLGQDYGAPEGSWSSQYNQNGTPYAGDAPAWSAAFISYVMRTAGAGAAFPYTPLHADYINAGARNEGILHAERPETYAPQVGDLICLGRLSARTMRFDDLPTGRFFGHCDIVATIGPGQLEVIGGNVAGGVTLKHVPVTAQGTLAEPDGVVLDGRYPWFVVLRVDYGPTS